jgi:hypothetical protein
MDKMYDLYVILYHNAMTIPIKIAIVTLKATIAIRTFLSIFYYLLSFTPFLFAIGYLIGYLYKKNEVLGFFLVPRKASKLAEWQRFELWRALTPLTI